VTRERNGTAAWAVRVCLFVALCTTAAAGGAVSAQPPVAAVRGVPEAAPSMAPEAAPSRPRGIAAQDNWLGD
jgi:hypothetical protein